MTRSPANRLLVALLLATAAPASAEAACRPDALGNLVCRPGSIEGRPALPERNLLDPGGFATEPVPRAHRKLLLPAPRVNAFGGAQLPPGAPGLATTPRSQTRLCRTDALGNYVCR